MPIKVNCSPNHLRFTVLPSTAENITEIMLVRNSRYKSHPHFISLSLNNMMNHLSPYNLYFWVQSILICLRWNFRCSLQMFVKKKFLNFQMHLYIVFETLIARLFQFLLQTHFFQHQSSDFSINLNYTLLPVSWFSVKIVIFCMYILKLQKF